MMLLTKMYLSVSNKQFRNHKHYHRLVGDKVMWTRKRSVRKQVERSPYQKESWISELFEKKPSGNKPLKTLFTDTLTLKSESRKFLRSGYPDTISCLIPKFPTDRKTERRRPHLRLHCIWYRYRYSYFCHFSTESKRVPLAIFPCKTPCFSATTASSWTISSFAVSHNSQGSMVSQKQPKMTSILHVARAQLKHNSSVTQPYRACNTQHVVSRVMERVATYALRQ